MTRWTYEELLERSVQDSELRARIWGWMTDLLRTSLPKDHWYAVEIAATPEAVRDHLLRRWFKDFKTTQPQLPIKALATLAEVAARNAQTHLGDPPEGEPLYSIEPLGLEETARLRTWSSGGNRTYTHIAYFSNLGLQPHYYCPETGEWVCL